MPDDPKRLFEMVHLAVYPNTALGLRMNATAFDGDGRRLTNWLYSPFVSQDVEFGWKRCRDVARYFTDRGYEVTMALGRNGEDKFDPASCPGDESGRNDGPRIERRLVAKVAGVPQSSDDEEEDDAEEEDDEVPAAIAKRAADGARKVPHYHHIKTRLCVMQKGICAACDVWVDYDRAEIEHIQPYSAHNRDEQESGHAHRIENLAYSCKQCNRERGTEDWDAFVERKRYRPE